MLTTDYRRIGNSLFTIRKHAGFTQSEIAEKAELSLRTYADIERGVCNMRLDTLLKICAALHITPNEILTTDEDDYSQKQSDVIARLDDCSSAEKSTALHILEIYLSSLHH